MVRSLYLIFALSIFVVYLSAIAQFDTTPRRGYTEVMKVLKSPSQLLHKFGAELAPKNREERRAQRVTAIIIAFVAALALLYYFFI